MRFLFAVIFFFLPLVASSAYLCSQIHLPDYLFGLEFTITNEKIITEGNNNPKRPDLDSNPIKKNHWEKIVQKIKEKCAKTGDCTTTMTYDKHDRALKVMFKDNFYFTIGSDSAALEANAHPRTTEGYRKVLGHMEDYLFSLGKEVGLEPHERAGGGHIHISRLAFEENSLAFRNFLVDFQNRPELIYGGLGNHLGNSAPLAALKSSQRDAFEQVLKTYKPEVEGINTLITRLHSEVFTEGFIKEWGGANYYQAFNMTRMMNGSNSATLELRSFRPQENTKVFQLQIYLLEAWVNKIKGLQKPLPYVRKDSAYYTPQQIVDSFAQLLQSLGLPWNEFSVLLPPNMRTMKPAMAYKSVNYDFN